MWITSQEIERRLRKRHDLVLAGKPEKAKAIMDQLVALDVALVEHSYGITSWQHGSMTGRFCPCPHGWQRVRNRMDRVWVLTLGWGNYIRFYPNPGFQIGRFYWSKKRGFKRK